MFLKPILHPNPLTELKSAALWNQNIMAEVHGEEMLNHISKFLLVTAGDPLPVAMVIEGLVALCECEVTDVGTLWGVLGGQHHSKPLLQDNRTPVVIALCGLFELASDVDTETRHANNVFKVTALKYLWNCACSEDTKVCSAAFRALSKFKLEDYLPEHLSPKVVNKIGLLSDGAASGPLCGKNCVELVHHIPVECAEAFGHFLTSLIGTELKGVQRGVVYSALREMQVPSQAERALQSVTEVLPSLCSANINRDIKPVGLIKGTMMLEYHCERRSGRIGRQALSKELDQRQAMLETFLREVTLYTGIGGSEKSGWMGLSCLYLSEQWKGFVGKLLDTYCLFRLLDTHSVSVEEDLKDPLFLKKKTEAQDWSMSQLLDKLNSFARNNSECAPDMLLVVAGIISTRSATCCSEGVGELLSLLMDMVEGCTAVLMGQKPQPSPSASDTIVQALLGSVHPDLPLAVVLSAPHLVDSIMALHWDGLTDNVSSKLVALIDGLFEHFQRSPQWYTAVVLNHVLMKTLPTVDGLRGVMIKLIPFLEASTKSNSLELLSLTSGLVPALLLYGNHSQLAEAVLSVLQQKLSSLSLSELATAPAQVCSLNLAGGVVSLYASRRLSEEEAMLVVTVLAELATKAPQLALLHLSLSISLCGLGAHGCQKALSLADTIAAKWIQEASELVTTEEATDKVIPVLCGLSGLVGVNPLHCGDSNIEIANIFPFLKTLYSLVAGLLQKYVSHQDNTVCSSSVWLLSQVHSVVSNVLRHEEKVPLNYSYLSDDSVLNNLYVLLESLSSPPYHPYKIKVLNHLLKSLLACEEAQLPPADFSGLLAPLLVHRELEQRIIGCLVQLSETQGLRQLASYTCTPLVFSSLKTESKCVLLENVTVVLQILPIEQFTKFLQSATEESLRHLSGSDEDAQLQSLLTGAVDALSNTDISYEAKKGISAVTVRVFTEVCGIGKEASAAVHIKRPVLEKLAASLSHCDPKQVSLLCEVSQDCPVSLKLCVSAVMHCCWVKAGVRKVKTLIRVVEWILNTIDDPGIVSPLSWLLQAIVDCCSTQSSKIYEMNQSDFLLILSAWTKTAKVVTSVQADMLLLLVTLVCGGSNAEISHHLDIAVDVPREQQVSDDRLQSLVDSQSHLLTPPESQPIREKLCLFLLDLMNVPSLSKDKVLGLILALKSTAEFSAPLIWTSIAQWWDST